MNVRHRLEISQTQRDELKALVSGGRRAARTLKRAQILLAANAGVSDEEIASSFGVGKEEALLVAAACSNPPEGRARWTLKLL